MNAAIADIENTTQQNAALGEETTAACRLTQLAQESRRLADMVGEFTLWGDKHNDMLYGTKLKELRRSCD